MKTCPKCGFKNERQQAADCPKCGLIYAKYQKAKKDESDHIFAESELNDSLRRAMATETEEHSLFIDLESEKDRTSYKAITFLSWFFIIFSGILGLVWVAGINFFWSFLSASEYIKGADKFIVTLLFAIFTFLPIAMYWAISGALELGKAIADNTRATRNYLAHIAQRK